jgi:(p)ppGpp synthase/HD superfamily hydrolase
MDEHAPPLGRELSFVRGLPITREAIAFAANAHEGRLRASDGAPFVLHPPEVAALLAAGGAGDAVVAAGVLHDVVEHEGTPLAAIEERFGPRVSALVAAVTEDPAIEPKTARKAALRAQVVAAGPEAGTIFAADQLARVRELRVELGHGDAADRAGRLQRYTASLAALAALIGSHPLIGQLRFELEALVMLPPAPAPAVYA